MTFISNHDTDSTQNHWPFPSDRVGAGYAYILTHPGLPCIFWDHYFTWGAELHNQIHTLAQVRLGLGPALQSKKLGAIAPFFHIPHTSTVKE